MTDLTIAHCAFDQPMGAQVYQQQIIRRVPTAVEALGWSGEVVTARSLRSPLPGTHRVPLTWLRASGPTTRRAFGRALFHGRRLVHRLDLSLPPGPVDVVTLHDVVGWRFPDEERPSSAAAEELRQAAAVVCVSEFSAQEARDLLGVERVHVVPNGVDAAFLDAEPADAATLAARGVRRPFVLVGAGATERKNLAALARAWTAVHAVRPDVQLVLSGPDHPRRDALFAGLPQVVRTGWLPAPEVPRLMAAADAVVLPSRYEGFGLPALEAMATRTPLVATDIPALREVVADHATLVSPDVDGLVDGIRHALDGGSEISAVVEQGRERAGQLTWEASVAGHLAVWQSVTDRIAAGR